MGSIPASRTIRRKSLFHKDFSEEFCLLHRLATKALVMSSNLVRRAGIWWVRLVIPARLRELAGKREFSQSARTHELHIAKLVAAVLLGNWRR